MNPYSAELCHHGILGQRWGIRRFQNPDGSVTAAGAKRYQTGKRNKQEKEEAKDPNLKKKIAIGAAVAGTALAVIGGAYLYKSGKLDGLINAGKSILQKNKGAGGIDEELAKEFTKKVVSPHVSTDFKGINPARNALSDVNFVLKAKDGKPLQDANCQACTFAYEYKRRTGRDVAAHLIDTRQFTNEYLMEKVYKNPKIVKDQAVSSWGELGSKLSKMGNGARGNLLLNTATGKHSIAFEVVNGKTVFMDTQIQQAFGADSKAFDVVYGASKSGISYLRTDNLQFNDLSMIKSLIHSV